MKKILLALAILCLWYTSTIWYASFQPQVQLQINQETSIKTLINTFLGNYVSNKTPNISFVNDMMTKRNAIVTVLNTREVQDTTFFGLEYLVYVMDTVVDDITESIQNKNTVLSVSIEQQTDGSVEIVTNSVPTQTYTNTNYNKPNTSTQNTYSHSYVGEYRSISVRNIDTDDDKILLWGEFSGPVSKFEFIANLAPITIREILIGSNVNNFPEAVDYIYIYDEDGDLIASRSINDNMEELSLDLTIPVGQTDIYVALETAEIGYGSSAPRKIDFELQMRILETIWENSGRRKTSYSTQKAENRLTIQATEITNVTLSDRHDGNELPDVLLWSGIDQDIAYLTIYTAQSNNSQSNSNRSLDTQIQTIDISIQDNTSSQNSAQSLRLVDPRRWDWIYWNLINNDTIRFNLRNDDLGYIENGEDRTYILSVTPDLDDNRNEAIRVYIENINDWAITYSTASELNTIYDTLDLSSYRLQGVTVSE